MASRRTSQPVNSATLYYRTNASNDWIRLDEAYQPTLQGKKFRNLKEQPEFTEPTNVEKIVFDSGIQIEQAAEKYKRTHKSVKIKEMEKPESRWRIRFEYGQYTNVFVKEYLRPHSDPKKPAITFIEIIFDVLAPPASTDATIHLPQVPMEVVERSKEVAIAAADVNVVPETEEVTSFEGASADQERFDFDWDAEAVTAAMRPSRDLPLAHIFENCEERGLTSIRLVFQRSKAGSGPRQWSWPATVQFLQGYKEYEKPDTLVQASWKSILAGSVDEFVSSGANHSSMYAEGDGFRIPHIEQNQDIDTSLATNTQSPRHGSPATGSKGGDESGGKKDGKRRANMEAEGQSDPKHRKGITKDKLDREYLELTYKKEWLKKDIAARLEELDELEKTISKNRQELMALF